jgi:hypothetical protein
VTGKPLFPPGSWSYIGDEVVGVVCDCTCPVVMGDGEEVPPHEQHDIIRPIMSSEYVEDGNLPWEEYVAACKLVAAAPDMLHRLKVRTATCGCYGSVSDPGRYCEDCKADLDVIAKAEGA